MRIRVTGRFYLILLLIVLVLPSVGTAILVAAMSIVACYELLINTGFVKHVRIYIYTCVLALAISLWSWLGLPRTLGMAAVLVYLCALFESEVNDAVKELGSFVCTDGQVAELVVRLTVAALEVFNDWLAVPG